MLCYNFEKQEMIAVEFVASLAPEFFYQGNACTVMKPEGR